MSIREGLIVAVVVVVVVVVVIECGLIFYPSYLQREKIRIIYFAMSTAPGGAVSVENRRTRMGVWEIS